MAYFSFVKSKIIIQHDNILTAYPNITVKTDPLYIGGRVSFLACNTISLIFLFVEIVILFVGTNMFRERMNFISNFWVIFRFEFAFFGGYFMEFLYFPAMAV